MPHNIDLLSFQGETVLVSHIIRILRTKYIDYKYLEQGKGGGRRTIQFTSYSFSQLPKGPNAVQLFVSIQLFGTPDIFYLRNFIIDDMLYPA